MNRTAVDGAQADPWLAQGRAQARDNYVGARDYKRPLYEDDDLGALRPKVPAVLWVGGTACICRVLRTWPGVANRTLTSMSLYIRVGGWTQTFGKGTDSFSGRTRLERDSSRAIPGELFSEPLIKIARGR